jgi:hypothetical protein
MGCTNTKSFGFWGALVFYIALGFGFSVWEIWLLALEDLDSFEVWFCGFGFL